jgi:hypothetical protein
VAGSFEDGNEPSDCIKFGEYLDSVSDYQIQKKDDECCSLVDNTSASYSASPGFKFTLPD